MLSAASMFKNMLNIRENVKKDQKLAVIKDQAIQDQLTSVTSQSFFQLTCRSTPQVLFKNSTYFIEKTY